MLSAALASQTTVAAGLTDFVTPKRWESSFPHASSSFAESQSRELLVAPGTGSLFFDQPLLEKIFSQLKEDLLSSPLSNCVRRLSVALLADVEQQGHGSLGDGVLAVGISHSLPLDSRFIRGTHPLPFVQPHVHMGQSLGGGGSLVVRERSDRAGFSSFSRLLQPAVCGDEGLRVAEAGHRPLATESECSKDFFQDGDSPVCSSLGAERRLDGIYRLEGCVLASSDASGQPQVPQIRSIREGVSVQSPLLWTLHGSASLHAGHGSGFGFSSPVRHSSSSLPRRLANPSFLPGAGSPCSGHSSPSVSFAGDRCQLGEVSVSSYSTYGVSGSSPGLCLFQGFSCPKESREASLNR